MELFDKINYKIKSQTSNKTFKVIINKLKHKDWSLSLNWWMVSTFQNKL